VPKADVALLIKAPREAIVNITAAVATTVTWLNVGLSPHTATADNGAFDSGTEAARWISSGAAHSFTFRTPGTYTYSCVPHRQLGMSGVIVVQ
jgi:plastocyanin